jgi:hypothetical protein
MPYESSATPYTAQEPPSTPVITPQATEKRRFFRKEKIGPAFWTIASIISLVVNIILVVVLIALGQQLFTLKYIVQNQVLGGLYQNFVMMDQAHIRTTIPVSAQVPAKFTLPLSTNTTVTLTEDTRIDGATLYQLNAGALSISQARLDIVLPAGTRLPVNLNLEVPVDQKIPVELNVNVDIPLNQTELHQPFVGLRKVIEPYFTMLDTLPSNWQQAVCGDQPSGFCSQLIK